ncbi:hypothetical protein EBZ39_10895 [bacterium]|nr:hypothetical protein [bacterium]
MNVLRLFTNNFKNKTMLNKENIKHALQQYLQTLINIEELCGKKNKTYDELAAITNNPEFKGKFKELQDERKYWIKEIGKFITQKNESNEQ